MSDSIKDPAYSTEFRDMIAQEKGFKNYKELEKQFPFYDLMHFLIEVKYRYTQNDYPEIYGRRICRGPHETPEMFQRRILTLIGVPAEQSIISPASNRVFVTMPSNLEKLKNFIADAVDKPRLPYSANPIKFDRKPLFFGTTNDTDQDLIDWFFGQRSRRHLIIANRLKAILTR